MNRNLAIAATLALRVAGWLALGNGSAMATPAAGRAAMLLIAAALGGCAALPSQVERPVSQARSDVADTQLARIAAASTPEDARGLSGFRLLPDGSQAFDARVALIRRAETSLDVQYYQVAADGTGLQFLRELRDAATRGVRVRLLVDDLYAAGQDALFAGLAANRNVEVRIFNPLPARSGGFGTRIVLSMHEFSRVNRRMHNKLFIADNATAINGGRNIADEYFGRSEPANFIDMDVLSSGPVVSELSAVFDRYWNSVQAYPVQSLVGAGFDTAAARRAFDDTVAGAPAEQTPAATDALGQTSVAAQLAGGRLEQHFANATVLADAPSKVGDDATTADDTVTGSTLALVASARSEVLAASPYFVPGARGVEAMQQAVARNVSISVMTNSLATTDEPLVHFGYARYRSNLLKMGVRLYELMPTAVQQAADSTLERRGSLGRLHAKLLVVDGRHLFIGSMNMDQRSARLNTEIGLVIDSSEIANEVTRVLRRDRLPASYRLRLAAGRDGIEWVSGKGDAERVSTSEPDTGAAQQLRLWVTSRFVGEEML